MATNEVFENPSPVSVAVGSATASGDAVVVGHMAGVALTDYDATSGEASVAFDGVYDLSVKGVTDGGNVAVAVGDPLYAVSGDTPVVGKKAAGVFIGYALETVGSGSTATIPVRLPGMGNVATGYYSAGVFVSDEITGNGSSQSTAHGLGVVPSKVVIVPTEFASNISYDAAEGSHTNTNALATVTNGAKYRIIAFK